MKKLYLTFLALFTWMTMSVASFAIDVIVMRREDGGDDGGERGLYVSFALV